MFHLHGGGDRWRCEPASPTGRATTRSPGWRRTRTWLRRRRMRLDSQSVGPGESFNLEIEGGAGGVQQSAGDFLLPLPHLQALRVGHVGAVAGVRHPAAGPRPAARPDRATGLGGVGGSHRPDHQRHHDHPGEPRRLDPAAAARPGHPPQRAGRHGLELEDRRHRRRAPLPGAPADARVFPGSPQVVPGQPNLLAIDVGHIAENRPAIRFNPVNGRPAYPLFRPQIGKRPPFTGNGHSGTPWLGTNVDKPATTVDPYARRVRLAVPGGAAVALVQRRLDRHAHPADADGHGPGRQDLRAGQEQGRDLRRAGEGHPAGHPGQPG